MQCYGKFEAEMIILHKKMHDAKQTIGKSTLKKSTYMLHQFSFTAFIFRDGLVWTKKVC